MFIVQGRHLNIITTRESTALSSSLKLEPFVDLFWALGTAPVHIHYTIILLDRAGRAFLDLRSRVPGVLGKRAHGNAIFFKACGNAEREEVGTLISRA